MTSNESAGVSPRFLGAKGRRLPKPRQPGEPADLAAGIQDRQGAGVAMECGVGVARQDTRAFTWPQQPLGHHDQFGARADSPAGRG
ncbi:hypothetical protein SAMN04487981_105219 [Streptomyces sp. cf386]|nr:hypothetical protein SAMN04487981_105219 [Streptomyces sp. cf386]